MVDPLPPLPYRPLEVRGHGVWDPARSAFYPFKLAVLSNSATTLSGKRGVYYFVHELTIEADVTISNSPVNYVQVRVTKDGSNVFLATLYLPTITSSATVGAHARSVQKPDVLCDAGKSIVISYYGATDYSSTVVYAEIPADEGELP